MDTNPAKIMHACPSTLDRITSLPDNIIWHILSLMPLQYAARTSLLSTSWRHKWRYIPELVFDNEFYQLQSKNRKGNEDKLIWVDIFRILLLHQGTITGLTLCINKLKSCSEVDQLFLFLCGKTIQEFTFGIDYIESYHLPSHLFSYDNLRKLTLSNCVFKSPPTFRGFHRLSHLAFYEVFLECDDFHQGFISHCPLLEYLSMVRCGDISSFVIDFPNLKSLCLVDCCFSSFRFERSPLLATVEIVLGYDLEEESSNCLLRFFDCLPAVKTIRVNSTFLEYLTSGESQKRLPTDIQSLQALELEEITLGDVREVSWIMCLVMSSPNLKYLKMKVLKSCLFEFNEVFKYEDVSNYSSEQLTRFEIEEYSGAVVELEFVKYLLTKLASLEVLVMKFSVDANHAQQVALLKDIVQLPRISPKAKPAPCFNTSSSSTHSFSKRTTEAVHLHLSELFQRTIGRSSSLKSFGYSGSSECSAHYIQSSPLPIMHRMFLLSLPVATVIKLVTKESMLGCISYLYESFSNLNESYIQPNQVKDSLLNPKMSHTTNLLISLLPHDDAGPSKKKFYRCRDFYPSALKTCLASSTDDNHSKKQHCF